MMSTEAHTADMASLKNCTFLFFLTSSSSSFLQFCLTSRYIPNEVDTWNLVRTLHCMQHYIAFLLPNNFSPTKRHSIYLVVAFQLPVQYINEICKYVHIWFCFSTKHRTQRLQALIVFLPAPFTVTLIVYVSNNRLCQSTIVHFKWPIVYLNCLNNLHSV